MSSFPTNLVASNGSQLRKFSGTQKIVCLFCLFVVRIEWIKVSISVVYLYFIYFGFLFRSHGSHSKSQVTDNFWWIFLFLFTRFIYYDGRLCRKYSAYLSFNISNLMLFFLGSLFNFTTMEFLWSFFLLFKQVKSVHLKLNSFN